MAVTPLPAGSAHVPRAVALLGSMALLVWVNRNVQGILPAMLALVVLYAALTNLERAQALIEAGPSALAGLIHPSTPPAPAAGGGSRPPLLR